MSNEVALIGRRRIVQAAGAALMTRALPGLAQGYPSKPIKLVVAFAAGGATDALARLMAAHLSESLGQQVIVDNRSGAGGNVGSSYAASSPADGYTLLLGAVGNIAINPALYASLPYRPRDLVPVGTIASTMNLLVARQGLGATSVQELVALARQKPGALTFASAGSGGSLHLSAELFKFMAGVNMVHVPYRGSAPALQDLLADRVDIMFDNLPSSSPHVQAGKLRALGVTARERSSVVPHIPTIAEQGLPGDEVVSWFGIFAPPNTPAPIVNRLATAMLEGTKSPELVSRIKTLGAEPMSLTQSQFTSFVNAEILKWDKVVKQSGAKAD
jgi:tripartite-type tricarboxylate transporter receptor subunit TctC